MRQEEGKEGAEEENLFGDSVTTDRAQGAQAAALRRARQVVGLYGDPESTWGISVGLDWSLPVDTDQLGQGWQRLCAAYPHLGAPGVIQVCSAAEFGLRREQVTAAPYLPGEPPVRVLVTGPGDRMLVAAHHGVVDGLGLLAVGSGLTGRPIVSAAQGIGDRPSRHGFFRSGARRVVEALFSPPGRFPGSGVAGDPREDLRLAELEPRMRGSAALGSAVLQAQRATGVDGRTVLLLGASRRPGSRLAPDRQTAYLRLRPARSASTAQVTQELRSTAPEPDFPETAAGGIGPVAARLLRSRLGATALISNLGRVSAQGLRSVAMFPAPSGPRAVALGLATTDHTTTLTLRTQRADFTEAESAALFAAIRDAYLRT